MRCAGEQRQENPGDPGHADDIDGEGFLEAFERELLQRLAAVLRKYTSVIDQHIEAVDFGRSLFRGGLDAFVVPHIKSQNIDATGRGISRGSLQGMRRRWMTRSSKHPPTPRRHFCSQRQPDSAAATGDENRIHRKKTWQVTCPLPTDKVRSLANKDHIRQFQISMRLSAKPKGPSPASLLAFQILAPLAALFIVLVLLLGLAARYFFEPLAVQRDLLRAERYAKTSAVVFSERLPDKTALELSEEFWAAGLDTLRFIPPSESPSWVSPRYLTVGPYVEAWAPVTGSGGSNLGAVTIRRQADAVVFVNTAIRAFAAASCVAFALLAALIWLLLKRRVTDRLASTVAEVDPPRQAPRTALDAVEETRQAIVEKLADVAANDRNLRRLLENHTELACVATPEGKLLEVNNAYCRFFGKKREELLGASCLDLVAPSYRMDVVNHLRSLTSSNSDEKITHSVTRPDGSTSWVRWQAIAIPGAGGKTNEILSLRTDITEQVDTEQRLKNLRQAFDQMQSLAETGSLTWDFAADRMEWTAQTRRLLGLEESAPASLDSLLAIVAPDEREIVRRLFLQARQEGRDFQHEFRAVLPDGSLRILQGRAEVLADTRTKILNHLTCTLRDITALRDAEAATKRELRFREAIEQSMGVGLSMSDSKGNILFVNPAFCQMTGWSQNELIGMGAPYPYWPEEEMHGISMAFEQAIAGKTPASGFELKFCRKDGTRFDVLVKVAPVFDSADRQLGWLGAVTDISVLQNARRELQATNERLRIAQDVAEFGIWDWDPVTDTLFWDRNSFAIFGHPEATDPKTVWAAVHGEEVRERLTYELRRLIEAGGESGQDSLHVRWPDGSMHEILSTYVIIRDKTQRATRVLGINRDVTSQVEEERELRSAQERLAAALEGGSFGTFEHVIGFGDVNWNATNYEINGIDPSITDPAALFAAWKQGAGDYYEDLMAETNSLPVTQNAHSYSFTARPHGKEPRRVRVSVFIERNKQGHPVRLVGVTRRVD